MVLILLILVFLVLSAFFSGSEIAFISANKLGIAVKKEQKTRTGQIISGFYEKPQSFLSTMLVGNNIALVAFTYFMTAFMMPFIEPGFGNGVLSLLIYTLITTVIILIAGEFFPKTYFNLHSTKMLFLFAYPLYFFKKLLAFPTYLMTSLSEFLLKRILRVPVENAHDVLTRLDLENYIADSLSDDQDDIDKEILTNALNLGHLRVFNCMVPRTEIVSIDNEASLDELIEVFKESKLSRIIVTDGDADNIEGYIHHQQLLHKPGTLKKMTMEILYVPDVMNLKDLMLQFIKDETSIACVVDEFGGTAGIITLEDILEEIFGEIEDEHDVEEYTMEKVGEHEYLFSGRLEVDFINEKYPELDLPEGEYQTLSGYIVMTSETIPSLGEQVELGQNIFKIEEVDDTKIEIVRVIHTPEKDE